MSADAMARLRRLASFNPAVDGGVVRTHINDLRALLDAHDEALDAAGGLLEQAEKAEAERDAFRAQLRELREVAERNVADVQHLRQSAISLTDERDALRAQVATADEAVRYWTAQAQHEANDAAVARAQVEAVRAACEGARLRGHGMVLAADVLAAMDEAKP